MDQDDLFAPETLCQNIDLHGHGELAVYPAWLDAEKVDSLMRQLNREINWEQPSIVVYGRSCKIPRLQAWYGEKDAYMTYSGTRFSPQPWHPLLFDIKCNIEAVCHTQFNSVLVNLYRNGNDSVSWHADDEPELGLNPTIASLSLGCQREFRLRPKSHVKDKVDQREIRMPLNAGDLLIMRGKTQAHWHHAILKERGVEDARINLTYRFIHR